MHVDISALHSVHTCTQVLDDTVAFQVSGHELDKFSAVQPSAATSTEVNSWPIQLLHLAMTAITISCSCEHLQRACIAQNLFGLRVDFLWLVPHILTDAELCLVSGQVCIEAS